MGKPMVAFVAGICDLDKDKNLFVASKENKGIPDHIPYIAQAFSEILNTVEPRYSLTVFEVLF